MTKNEKLRKRALSFLLRKGEFSAAVLANRMHKSADVLLDVLGELEKEGSVCSVETEKVYNGEYVRIWRIA